MLLRQTQTLILFFMLAALPLSLKATHIVGGEMTYRCLGSDLYEVKLTIFRDCFNGIPWFDNPASIGVYANQTNQYLFQQLVPLDPFLNDTIDGLLDDCLVEPPNVCVNTTTYTTLLFLPFIQGGYHLSYQRCCRNNTIVNLVMPEDVGATYSVVITEEAMQECNASPEFNEWPPLFLCGNLPFQIDQSAFDTDGDSLVYKLCDPFLGATDSAPQPQPPGPPPYSPVPWAPGYGVDNMLNPAPAPSMVIDPVTGLLTGTPTILGQFVIGICIEEYRNGQLIGEYRRDYQVNVGDCQATVAAFASADGTITCGTKTVFFENQSTNANEFLWIFNDPNNPGATSTAVNPTYTFTDWGTYEVALIAEPGDICSDTTTVAISVQPNSLLADFDVDFQECLNDIRIDVTDLSTDTFSTITSWEWTLTVGNNVFTSTEQNPSFVVAPPGGGILTLVVTNAVGCTAMFEDIFPLKPPLLNLDLGPDITGCQIGQVELNAGPGFVSYLWSDGSTAQSLVISSPGTYGVMVTDACGKTAVDEVVVSLGSIVVDAGDDETICSPGKLVTLNGSVTGSYNNVQWQPSAGLSDPNSLTPQVFVSSTTTFTLTVSSSAIDNHIVNGDFEMGSTGFTSDYGVASGGTFGPLSNEGEYLIATNASDTHINFSACTDHTSGMGNMMVINGASVPNENIWCQTVSVNPNADYEFSAWMTSVHPDAPAILQYSINGVLLGSPFELSSETCTWDNFFETWNSGANTSAEICIVNQNTTNGGNDFAIDDLFFGPVCIGSDELTIFVAPTIQTMESIEICEGETIVVFGNPVSAAGTFSETFTTGEGCDSTHTITVSVLDVFATSESIEICEGDTAIVFGQPVTNAGSVVGTFTAQNGCDSTHTVTIFLKPTVETTETIGICEGESIEIFGNTVSDAGVYSATFTGQNGCDSTHVITLEIYQTYHIFDDGVICEGDTAYVFGMPVTMEGEFSDTMQTINGCDSILTITIGVLPVFFTEEERSICFGETTDIFGAQVGMAGVYEMVFTSSIGCDSTHTITLEVYDEIVLEVFKMDASCFGLSDGSVAAIATGGNGGFIYQWSTGDIGDNITDLPAGDYSVTATDVTGCTKVGSITINEPPLLVADAIGVDVSCTELGSATASATGGTGAYSYLWSTGETTATIDSLVAGSYTVTVSDENNCKTGATVEITGELAPTIGITIDQQLTQNEPNSGQLTVDIAGGIPPYEIEWSNGGTTATIDGLSSGQYIVTVTDQQGCEVQDTAYLFISGCTGGKIWNDRNRNGCQEGGEYGIPDVDMVLQGVDIWGNNITATATTAINGEYVFPDLPPGEYLIFMNVPDGYLLSPADNCTDDFVDSDFDAVGVATTLLVLDEGHCCLIYDGGLYDDCLNVADAGEICCDQVLCGPGNIAAPITSVATPTGASQVEYVWIYSEVTPNNPAGSAWTQVKDAMGNPVKTPSLNPGAVYTTTHYARCVRAVGCTEWLVSEVVTVTVDDVAVALIDKPGAICVGNPYTFTAAANQPGAKYLWNFGPYATPQFSNTASPTVTFTQANYTFIYLTVTNNGCVSSSNMLIAVSNDPTYCGSTSITNGGNTSLGATVTSFSADGQFLVYPNPVSDQLTIEWGGDIKSSVQMEILGLDGKLLVKDVAGEDTRSFRTDVGQLSAGVYLLRLRHGNGHQEVFKLVKQ